MLTCHNIWAPKRDGIRALLTRQNCAGSYKAAQLLEWVSEVLLLEDQLAYEYWVIMFPLVWGSLSDKKDNQVFLAKPVIQLLSQEYHHRQADKRPNVIPVRPSPPQPPYSCSNCPKGTYLDISQA